MAWLLLVFQLLNEDLMPRGIKKHLKFIAHFSIFLCRQQDSNPGRLRSVEVRCSLLHCLSTEESVTNVSTSMSFYYQFEDQLRPEWFMIKEKG